jgi:hypothetical protein
MTSKLLLSTLATAALVFGAPAAYSADGKTASDGKEQAHCDKAKDKNCKDEHDQSKEAHKDGDKHPDGHDSKDEKKK